VSKAEESSNPKKNHPTFSSSKAEKLPHAALMLKKFLALQGQVWIKFSETGFETAQSLIARLVRLVTILAVRLCRRSL
jgi:hypothetical protein